jgi:hypothetical protein
MAISYSQIAEQTRKIQKSMEMFGIKDPAADAESADQPILSPQERKAATGDARVRKAFMDVLNLNNDWDGGDGNR